MRKIVLASASPRRKKLLEQIGLRFTVDPSEISEDVDQKLTPKQLVKKLSFQKAKSVAARYADAIIIAADSVVVAGNVLFGKPRDAHHAKIILKKLSGRNHTIITGITVWDTATGKIFTDAEESIVHMRKLSKKEIDAYVVTGEPLDKAGAYGIQEKGGVFIDKVIGDYFNVVGLPISLLTTYLKKLGVSLWS